MSLRDRQIESGPSFDEIRGILAAYTLVSVWYVKPGHLAFDTQMPSGRIGSRIVQTRRVYQYPICPIRRYRWNQWPIGQTRTAVGAEPPFGKWR